ncbi:hypothetical protein A3A20_00995 [Candidatus Wolfebacteria bacterium RIFCSPLOWO2_01_FULL_45_19]|uniref:Uncharacterized protein n=1 Tax=Candidatus Wolfebacteria bacterium RIFCSPLOWO2_01_FULL_45_19 TaxID=1802557 RepID=A0A1F8DQC0_9BACT|nr:MAG: hypothetical protein UX23_C0003G0024 [Parcubacteria group bacterium GW2011_GWB1_45_9]OGM90814.1 MAG: hypothetical protein A3A20_00995 [Candidatus Wolfebacteria bacterium RIFCSPLOWO2_01_FULL_45_19]
MSLLFSVFVLISFLFFILLAIKEMLGLKFCVLCASVSAAWLGLLTAYIAGFWNDAVLLAIFMGGSVVGIMYLLEKKLPPEFDIFRLPFYLSGAALVWFILARAADFGVLVLLAGLWLVTGAIYALKNKSKVVKKIAERLIACCRDW